ncbi:serine/threonine kinase [Pseudanabaena sp. lw0831]|uniref:formylglycine-generating enzyme family protein n=1 Tax=Pseudanabaena sp. lw0831 TaxID=1357935 RepID=UPI00191581C1|nr:formylglycine-generating enzyme family protein [Pseudanabaena sp. lw0831]GBO53378.1 serine/threonine kinase [Pseudanabaena sp. lw0831]
MDLDNIINKRYRITQTIGIKQIGAIALSVYLAENLEMPITPKPLCVIYFWQVSEKDALDHEAIATKLYEIGQNYTLSPKVQAFFTEEDNCYLVREYLEGYEYLEEFSRIFNDFTAPEVKKTSEVSTVKALPIERSWVKSLAKVPIKINRRQLLISTSSAIAGFTLAIFLENLKPQPAPIIIAESPPVPEPPRDPIKRGDKAFRDDLGNGVHMEMVRIPSGRFSLGSPTNEIGRRDNESPISEVNIPAFYMAKFVVTQEQWVAIMGSNPALFRENLQAPVENISWLEAQDFCRKLAARSQHLYRLPSESEWEYACRAGTNTAYHFGDGPTELVDYAWFADNANKRSHPVGQKVPNPWGLYEMHGGVWEWCEDVWHDNFNGAPADGSAWVSDGYTSRRVRKGGSWSNEAKLCRAASREWHWQSDRYNDIGFRVVISAM